MRHFLRKAFSKACNSFQRLTDLYYEASFAGYRLLMDDDFLTIDESKISSPLARRAVGFYHMARDKTQDGLSKHIFEKSASGDVGPKPDYKRPALKLAEALLIHAGRSHSTSMTLLGLTAIGAATMIAAFGGGTPSHIIPDAMAAWLGSRPQSIPTQLEPAR